MQGGGPPGKSTALGRRLGSSCRRRRPSPRGGAVGRGCAAGGGPVGRGCGAAAGRCFFAGGVGRGGRTPLEMPRGTAASTSSHGGCPCLRAASCRACSTRSARSLAKNLGKDAEGSLAPAGEMRRGWGGIRGAGGRDDRRPAG
jgi:hypothetical protein